MIFLFDFSNVLEFSKKLISTYQELWEHVGLKKKFCNTFSCFFFFKFMILVCLGILAAVTVKGPTEAPVKIVIKCMDAWGLKRTVLVADVNQVTRGIDRDRQASLWRTRTRWCTVCCELGWRPVLPVLPVASSTSSTSPGTPTPTHKTAQTATSWKVNSAVKEVCSEPLGRSVRSTRTTRTHSTHLDALCRLVSIPLSLVSCLSRLFSLVCRVSLVSCLSCFVSALLLSSVYLVLFVFSLCVSVSMHVSVSVCVCLHVSLCLFVPVCSCEEFDMCASFRVFNVQAQRM